MGMVEQSLLNIYPNFALRGSCLYGDNVGCCVENTQFPNCQCESPPETYENFVNMDNFANLDNLANLETPEDLDEFEGLGK